MNAVEKQQVLSEQLAALPWNDGVPKAALLDRLRSDPPLHDLVRLYASDAVFHGIDEVLEEIPAASFRYVPGEERRMSEVVGMRGAEGDVEDRVMRHQAGADRASGGTDNAEAETSGLKPPEGTPNPGRRGREPRGPGEFAQGVDPPPVYDV